MSLISTPYRLSRLPCPMFGRLLLWVELCYLAWAQARWSWQPVNACMVSVQVNETRVLLPLAFHAIFPGTSTSQQASVK
jgi:hypothetical protein